MLWTTLAYLSLPHGVCTHLGERQRILAHNQFGLVENHRIYEVPTCRQPWGRFWGSAQEALDLGDFPGGKVERQVEGERGTRSFQPHPSFLVFDRHVIWSKHRWGRRQNRRVPWTAPSRRLLLHFVFPVATPSSNKPF